MENDLSHFAHLSSLPIASGESEFFHLMFRNGISIPPIYLSYVVRKNCASVLNQPRASIELQRPREASSERRGEEKQEESVAKVERLQEKDGGRGTPGTRRVT